MTDIYISPSGSDTAVGSQSAPLGTLQRAYECCQPGDTIWLRGGMHRCSGIMWVKPNTTLAAFPGERPVLQLSERGDWLPSEKFGGCLAADISSLPVASKAAEVLVCLEGGPFAIDCKKTEHFEARKPPLDKWPVTWYDRPEKKLYYKPLSGPARPLHIVSTDSQINFTSYQPGGMHDIEVRGIQVEYGWGLHVGGEGIHDMRFSGVKSRHCMWGLVGSADRLRVEDCVIDRVCDRYTYANDEYYRWWQHHGLYLAGRDVLVRRCFVGRVPSGGAIETVGYAGGRSTVTVEDCVLLNEVVPEATVMTLRDSLITMYPSAPYPNNHCSSTPIQPYGRNAEINLHRCVIEGGWPQFVQSLDYSQKITLDNCTLNFPTKANFAEMDQRLDWSFS